MSIFCNNITPSAPKDKSWNNIGYDAWIEALNESFDFDPSTSWYWGSAPIPNILTKSYNSKSELKKELKHLKKITDRQVRTLDEAVNNVYSKYGVWLKWKVQMSKNKRIKSIYFTKVC